MIITIVHNRCEPADRERVAAAVKDVLTASRSDPGCVEYTALEEAQDPGHFVWIECWSDQASLDAHLATPHVQTYREIVAPLIRERSSTVYEGVPIRRL
jgi:quinol monooxygenase YgiN